MVLLQPLSTRKASLGWPCEACDDNVSLNTYIQFLYDTQFRFLKLLLLFLNNSFYFMLSC
jgi:hypothetical protein